MTAQPNLWDGIAGGFAEAAAPRLSLVEWVEKYRIVAGDSPFPGKWRWRNAPMSREPMEAVSDRRVQQVTLWAPAQLMKSEFCVNVALWGSCTGQGVLFYEPNQQLVREFMGDRIRPALQGVADTAIDNVDDGRLKKRDSAFALRVAGGAKILGLSPEMKTGKSSHSAPIAVFDELDKMMDTQLLTVGRSRTAAFGSDACVVVASTPTDEGPHGIARQWSLGSRGMWMGCCPSCRERVPVDWSAR